MLDIVFARPELPTEGALAFLAAKDSEPTGLWREADAATSGTIGRALSEAQFTGDPGKTCTILSPRAGLSRVVVAGIGTEEPSARTVENGGGALAAALVQDEAAAIAADQLTPELAAHIAFGAALRAYRFDRYRTKQKLEDQPKLVKLVILTTDPLKAGAAWEALKPVAEAVQFTRDLVSEPANVLTPAEFARRCETLASLGIKVTTLGPKELEKAGFGALLAVAQGSANEPRVVVMQYNGNAHRASAKDAPEKPARRVGRSKPLAFIGKGVTFDTGGISIKPASGMEDMKWDMAGAGAVVGLTMALAGRHAKVDAVGLIGLVENMPSGTAQRPGDVVRSLSGQTIEVINTDAEGRLVLADVIAYCQQKYDPALMVDVATLTGAIIVGLGHEHAGLFSNDDTLAERLFKAGRDTGEKVWRMPLDEAYDKQLRSEIADMKNVGGRPAGSCTAAQFIQRFVEQGRPWAHLDVAGMVWSSKDAPVTPKGATGFGVRLLNRFVAENYES